MSDKKVNVGIIGLGFGKEFIPFTKSTPMVERWRLTRREDVLNEIGDQFGIDQDMRFTDYHEMVADDKLDAIHVVSPVMTIIQW